VTVYTERGYGPPKPSSTPLVPVLDRFGLALAGEYIYATAYTDNIPGLPVNVNQGVASSISQTTLIHARAALLGQPSPIDGIGGDNYTNASTAKLHDTGARIIHLAQCVREAGLCSQYLEYTTLPVDNDSGIFGNTTWLGTGTRYVGDINSIYNNTVSTLSYTAPMFSDEARDQYDNNPVIPFRLAYYIEAFMDTFYKDTKEA
jgi:hypothetical protein